MSYLEKLQAHFRDPERVRGFEIAGLSALFREHPKLIAEAEDGQLAIHWSRRHFATLKRSLVLGKTGTNSLVAERLYAGNRAELVIVPLGGESGK